MSIILMMTITAFSLQSKSCEGQGVLVPANGDQYEGGWQAGLRHGQGVCVYPNGDRYEGGWQAGERHGQGVDVSSSGSRYEGQWQAGKAHGHGVMCAHGGRYEGEWQEGKPYGQGVCVYPNGGRYEGGWQSSERHGQGVFVYADGGRYEGEWQGNQKHGQGVFVCEGGDRHEGFWQNDKREGRCTIRAGEGSLTREFEGGDLNVPTDCSDGNTREYPLQGRPLHAVVIQSLHDWNQAFQSSLDYVVRPLTACGYEVSVIQIGSTQELTQLRLATNTQLLWVRAHGSPSGCQFAQDPADLASIQEFKPLVQQLGQRSLMVLQSCNTSCIAEQIAREVPGTTVMAPTCATMCTGIAHTVTDDTTILRITMLGAGKTRNILAQYYTPPSTRVATPSCAVM